MVVRTGKKKQKKKAEGLYRNQCGRKQDPHGGKRRKNNLVTSGQKSSDTQIDRKEQRKEGVLGQLPQKEERKLERRKKWQLKQRALCRKGDRNGICISSVCRLIKGGVDVSKPVVKEKSEEGKRNALEKTKDRGTRSTLLGKEKFGSKLQRSQSMN